MQANDIKSLLEAVPFKPFRITTTRSGGFDVLDPRHTLLAATAIYLGSQLNDEGMPEEVNEVPLKQIASVRSID